MRTDATGPALKETIGELQGMLAPMPPEELTIVVVGDRKAIEPAMRLLPFVKSIEFRDVEGRPIKEAATTTK